MLSNFSSPAEAIYPGPPSTNHFHHHFQNAPSFQWAGPSGTESLVLLHLLDNIRALHSVHQIQRFLAAFVGDLQLEDNIHSVHHILTTMLSAASHQRLLSAEQLHRMVCSSKSAAVDGTPPPHTLSPVHCAQFVTESPPIARSSSTPLVEAANSPPPTPSPTPTPTPTPRVSHILSLPEDVLSYCFSFLATRDLLLSVDLSCARNRDIARMPSSFHGKFIFGSAIHCGFHKLTAKEDHDDDGGATARKMLQRFRHSKEVHFINIFNDDTVELLKAVEFSKMESVFLYDRFNELVSLLPALIPNVSTLCVSTNSGTETLDIIRSNLDYYSEPIHSLFEGYSHSMEAVELRHNTFYQIPLMLPEKVADLLLTAKMPRLQRLSLQNVYFPPDLGAERPQGMGVRSIVLSPYNEYCADHFSASLRSLSMWWNVVGRNNDIYAMHKLSDLESLRLTLRADNDSLDFEGLRHFLARSESLRQIASLELVVDLEDAVWSATERLWVISNHILNALGDATTTLKVTVKGVCRSNLYSNVIDSFVVQMMLSAAQQIEGGGAMNIEIEVHHPTAGADFGQNHQQSMALWIRRLQTLCSAALQSRPYPTNTELSLLMTDELSRVQIGNG